MDIDTVRSFLAVAAEGSYANAAPTLHRSVSSVSRRIHDLERELGVELFDRTSRGVHLSACGRDLLERAQELVGAADALIAAAHESEHVGIRLGISPGLDTTLRQRLIDSLIDEGIPAVGLVPGQNPQLIRKILHHQLDVALTHERPGSPQLVKRLVGMQSTEVLVAAGSSLATKDPLVLGDLVGLPLVASRRMTVGAPIYYAHLRAILGEAGIDEVLEVEDSAWIRELVASGSGFAIWVAPIGSPEHREDGSREVVPRPVHGMDLPLPTYLVHACAPAWLTDDIREALALSLPTLRET